MQKENLNDIGQYFTAPQANLTDGVGIPSNKDATAS
jgi:hypothetical protein